MPNQIHKRSPNKDRVYDEPGHVHGAPGSKASSALDLSARAGETADDIDDVLADNDQVSKDAKKTLEKNEVAVGGGTSDGKPDSKDKASEEESGKLGGLWKGGGAHDKPENNKALRKKARRVLWGSNKRRVLTSFAAGGIGAGVIFGSLTLLAPLKVIHMTQNLQNHYFASGEQAVEGTLDNLLKHYLIKQVMPGMLDGLCSTTKVDRTCATTVQGSGVVKQLFRAWRDAKLESKLANKYGIEIIRKGLGKDATFYIRTPDISGKDGVRLGTYDKIISYDGNLFAEVPAKDRDKVRRALKTAFAGESFWKRTKYRFVTGRFIERKYGIVRCIFACEIRDKGKDAWGRNVTDRKKAAKAVVAKTILLPASEAVSLAIECAISGFDCTAYDDADNEGVRKTQYERTLLSRVAALAAAGANIEDLLRDSDNIRNKGITYHLVEKIANEMSAKIAAKAIPIIGWIDLAVLVKEGAERAGPAIRYLSYAYATGVFVREFADTRIIADEVKDGYNTDATIVGAWTDRYSNEGGYTAEQSPLYQELMPTSSGSLASLVSPKVDAQGVPAILSEVCPDDPIPGEVICPNESLKMGPTSAIAQRANLISSGIDKFDGPIIGAFTDAWFAASNTLFEWLAGPIGWLIETLHADDALKWIADNIGLTKLMAAFAGFFQTQVLLNPFAPVANAINHFVMMAGGANVMANEECRDQLGCEAVSDAEAHAIRTAYLAEQREAFQSQSLFARLFDTESSYSAISQLALAAPSMNTGALQTNFANFMSDPFQAFANAFGGVFGGSQAGAAGEEDFFGIQQYAVPANHPVFSTDPEEYREKNNCDDPNQYKEWTDQHSEIDELSQQYAVTKTNGCKLMDNAITAGGAYFSADFVPARGNLETDTGDSIGTDTGSIAGWAWPMDPPIHQGPCFGQQVGSLGAHAGVDINTRADNNPVKAAHAGVVYRIGFDTYAGNYVMIKTTGAKRTYYYTYQHLKNGATKVRKDQKVAAGEVISIAGLTGRLGVASTTKGHLHMVVATSPTLGSYGNLTSLVNPLSLLPTAPGGYTCG